MIRTLRKKLLFLFAGSVMMIFTAAFCILIQKNAAAAHGTENDFFQRTATNLLLHLENADDYASNLKRFEQFSPLAFRLFDHAGNTLYQTDNTVFPDAEGIINAFEKESQKEDTSALTDSAGYNQSGTFYFSYGKKPCCGIYCKLNRSDGKPYTLFLVKQDKRIAEYVKGNLLFYILIWIGIFAVILVISRFLIRRATLPTENAIQSQKNFVAAASHELKAPLAVILANAETAASDPALSEHLLKNMSAIDAEVSRMSNLVQDLLLLSSIDASTWSLEKTETDICTLVLNVYEKFEPLCRKKKIELKLDLSDDVFPKFMADGSRLEQVLGIFLDNAIHYSKPDSSICLAAHSESRWLIFSIQDHGTGIADADKPFIFDRFYRADKSRSDSRHYGLGLCIAKELVEMHKGKIELLDTPGGGCTFKVYLPALFFY